MTELHQLLAVQDHDTRIDQLNHRKATMPERAQLAELRRVGEQLAVALTELTDERTALGREQHRLEDEIAIVEDKRRSVDAALYGGTVSNPRELQAMQEEIGFLARRQSQLEDQVIEIMERTEPIEARLGELDRETARNRDDVATGAQRVAESERLIEAELVEQSAQREAASAGVPEGLLQEYEQLRGRSGGVGVARLAGNQCGGCHLTLSAIEVAHIKKLPVDAVAHCEECGRILVR